MPAAKVEATPPFVVETPPSARSDRLETQAEASSPDPTSISAEVAVILDTGFDQLVAVVNVAQVPGAAGQRKARHFRSSREVLRPAIR